MKDILQEINNISVKTWIVLCLFFLLLFDMGGYYISVWTDNKIRPFYIMEQIAPFIKGTFIHDSSGTVSTDKTNTN